MQTSGKGHVESYEIFPGLAVLFYQFLAQQVHVVHPPAPFLLQIDYCDQGRVGWDMQNGDAIYLGTGDVCIHNLHHCANATMRFPLGFYRGVAILADLKALQINSPDIFQQTGFDPTALQKRFCKDNQACSILSCADTQHLFAPLCDAPHTAFRLCAPKSCRNTVVPVTSFPRTNAWHESIRCAKSGIDPRNTRLFDCESRPAIYH